MRRKSRSCCDFRYFLPKYFRYRLEKGASTVTWTFDFSLLMLTLSPKFPVLPSTLMRPSRNFSKSLVSMMLSEDGCSQSMVYLNVLFLPLSAPAFVFKPLATILLERKGLEGPMLAVTHAVALAKQLQIRYSQVHVVNKSTIRSSLRCHH